MDGHDRLFGEITVQLGLMTREQVSACMHTQKCEPRTRALGDIAVDLGYMTRDQVILCVAQRAKVLERRRKARRTGSGAAGVVEERKAPKDPRVDSARPPAPLESAIPAAARPTDPAPRAKRPGPAEAVESAPRRTPAAPRPPTAPSPPASPTPTPEMAHARDGARADSGAPWAGKRDASGTMLGHAQDTGLNELSDPMLTRTGTGSSAPPATARGLSTSPAPPVTSEPAGSEPNSSMDSAAPGPAGARNRRAWANASRPLVPSGTVMGTGPAMAPTAEGPASQPGGDAWFHTQQANASQAPPRESVPPAPAARSAAPRPAGGTMLGTGAVTDARLAVSAREAAERAAEQAEQAAERAVQAASAPPAAVPRPSLATPVARVSRVPPEQEVLLKAPLPRPAVSDQRPGEGYLDNLLKLAVQHGASDLHVHSGAEVMARIHGELRPMSSGQRMKPKAAEKVMSELMDDSQWELLAMRGQVDFAYELPGLARFRVNAYKQHGGLDIVFRIIPPAPPSLEALGLPGHLARLVDYRTGMVLCTGPAGCGKSSTLAALVNLVVSSRREHVLTVEDPIEFVYPRGVALVNQRQVATHTGSYASALKAALREDPDIIVIAEMRDLETISLAMSAAETGHLVLGSLHTGNAAQTIGRICTVFPAEEQEQARVMLAESLRAVISQRLVPTADGSGRVPALELLMVSTAVSNLIRDNKTFQLPSVMQTGKAAGMITLDDSLQALLEAGTITREEAFRFAVKRERFA